MLLPSINCLQASMNECCFTGRIVAAAQEASQRGASCHRGEQGVTEGSKV